MSGSDSFLDEVTGEVRRDRMIGFLRRNAVWIVAGVVLAVALAGAWEWRRAAERAQARAAGGALIAALAQEDPAARAEALAAITLDGDDGAALMALHRADALQAAGRREDAVRLLEDAAGRPGVAAPLRDVVRLRLAAAAHGVLEAQTRLDVLAPLTAEGHALRPMALEQRAVVHLAQGSRDAALEDLRAARDAEAATPDLQSRVARLIGALEARDDADG